MKIESDIIEYTVISQDRQREKCRMISPLRSLTNDKGSAIVLALMMLSLLTVMGIWATRKSNMEALIAGNEVARKQTFYRTESGIIEGGFAIEEENTLALKARTPTKKPGAWLFAWDTAADMTDPDSWDFDEVGGDDTAMPRTDDPEVGFCALDKGVTSGDSLVMTTSTQVRTYAIYGFHGSRMGQALIEVGYKRRF